MWCGWRQRDFSFTEVSDFRKIPSGTWRRVAAVGRLDCVRASTQGSPHRREPGSHVAAERASSIFIFSSHAVRPRREADELGSWQTKVARSSFHATAPAAEPHASLRGCWWRICGAARCQLAREFILPAHDVCVHGWCRAYSRGLFQL